MKISSFLIVGKHPVLEAIKNPKRKILRLFLTEESRKKIHKFSQKQNLLHDKKVFFKTKKELDNLTGIKELHHQGFVAEIEELENIDLKTYIKKRESTNLNFIALDEVTDPRNIGSIIRSAVSFGIDGLIVKERSFPSKSKLMYKSASGCLEHLQIFKVSNINTAIKLLKNYNFWVSGFDASATKNFTEHDWTGKNLLLFGSEGKGIREKTLEKCDFKFSIKMKKNIDSLNIANSVSIVCHYIFQK